MADYKNYDSEILKVKDNLVNTSLVVALLSGIPLLGFSIVRSFKFSNIDFVVINILVFLTLILITVFRNKVAFPVKAIYVLGLLLILAVTDFLEVGFVSLGYIWMAAASILSFVYFDLKRSAIVTAISLATIITTKMLVDAGLVVFSFDFKEYANSNVVLILRVMDFIIVSFVIVFSFRQITTKFDENLFKISLQRQNLMSSAIRMRREIEYRKISEQAAVNSENKFRNIFESSSDPMAIVDYDGRFLDYNFAFLKLTEVHSEQNLKELTFVDVAPSEYVEFFKLIILDLDSVPPRFDLKYISKLTGKTVFLDVTTTIIDYEGKHAVLAIFRDNTEKINRERLIYSAALEAEERERLRMSKELHDGLGPLLSTLKIYYEALEKRPNDLEIQRRIKNIMNDSISSVKEISNNLSPYVLQNLGIVKALKAFVDKIVFAGKLDIKLESNIDQRFNEKIEITVYRLVTELLNNTIQHAEAKLVNITLILDGSLIKIEYIDDGRGFDPAAVKEKSGGIGLFNMKGRIENMGGSCEFITANKRGFKLLAEINIDQVE